MKRAIDILLAVVMILLMSYAKVGMLTHEILGTAMAVLFIIHIIQHRAFYAGIFRGRHGAKRNLVIGVDLGLTLAMIVSTISGILISRNMYTFLGIPQSRAGHILHIVFPFWAYVLMGMHVGFHLPRFGKAGTAATLALSLWGIAAFFRRNFPAYLFTGAHVVFSRTESVALFFLDYIAIFVLFAALGWALVHLPPRKTQAGSAGQAA